jgi:hypothetical protein
MYSAQNYPIMWPTRQSVEQTFAVSRAHALKSGQLEGTSAGGGIC